MTINYEIQITHLQNPYLKHFSTMSKFPHPHCIKISEKPPNQDHSILDAIWRIASEICDRINHHDLPKKYDWESELYSTVLSRKFTYHESTINLCKSDGTSFTHSNQVVEGLLSYLSFNLTDFMNLPPLTQCAQLEKMDDIMKTRTLSDSMHLILHGVSQKKGFVYYYGRSLFQCTHQEKLIVSLALGILLNASKSVVRISDTQLLHSMNLSTISEIAKDNGYHLWVGNIEPSLESLLN
ncbi:MAG: hypothetical protein JSS53_04585 [Proteobacteria bacterium]|nr:hypothetical protein [Pseudomonadota bacterium]